VARDVIEYMDIVINGLLMMHCDNLYSDFLC
jgi:hypothetical protein